MLLATLSMCLSTVRGDEPTPVPVGAAILGSDLLVPLAFADPETRMPETVTATIGGVRVDAPVARVVLSPQAAFRWVTSSQPVDVIAPDDPRASGRAMVALAVLPVPDDADGEIELFGVAWTPVWLPKLAPFDPRYPVVESYGVDADPSEEDPMEWFRWVVRAELSGRRPPPCRMTSPLGTRVAWAVADEWRAGLRRVRNHSPSVFRTIAERLVATVRDAERPPGERQVAMWPTDPRELAGLRALLLDQTRSNKEVALAGLAWFEVRPPFVAWVADDAGEAAVVRIGNPTVDEVIVLANFSTWNEPDALILPPRSLTTHRIQRRGPSTPGTDEELILRTDQTEVRLEVGARTILVEPPGASFGPMVLGRTLASVNGEFVEMPDLPAQTAGILRRRFGRWEVFVEARGDATSAGDDDVFIQVGPSKRPVAVLRISRDGSWSVESGPVPPSLSVKTVEHGDRWRILVRLPEQWLVGAIARSAEGGIRLGLRRDGPRGIIQFAGPPPSAWRRRIPTQNFGLSWWDDPMPERDLDF